MILLEAGQARFGDGGKLRQRRHALGVAHAQRAQAPGLHVRADRNPAAGEQLQPATRLVLRPKIDSAQPFGSGLSQGGGDTYQEGICGVAFASAGAPNTWTDPSADAFTSVCATNSSVYVSRGSNPDFKSPSHNRNSTWQNSASA